MTAERTMFEKIWDAHVVAEGPGGLTLLFIDRHLLHEGATHAFDRLQAAGRAMRRPDLAVAMHPFEIDPFRKQGLLSGQDEVALTLTHEAAIAAFEVRRRGDAPWLAASHV